MWAAKENSQRINGQGIAYHGGTEASMGLDPAQLHRVLDEVDYGLLVVNAQGRLHHVNHLARHELASGRTLVAHEGVLMGATIDITAQIQGAMEQAQRGQRRLLLFTRGNRELSMAFVPLSHPLETDHPNVLILLSRQSTCDNLAVRMFARSQSLSPTEESVLISLCSGMEIPEIARQNRVAESTVRSQIKALREKTGCSSIRQLLLRVNSLPPVVPALRVIAPVPHNAGDYAQT